LHVVKPVVRDERRATPVNTSAGELRIAKGRFFNYALPQGWRVAEDGQFALTLIAPDSKALTVLVGVAGVQPNYPPDRFAYEKLMAMQIQNLRMSKAKQMMPLKGFAQGYQFDVDYTAGGGAAHGVVKVYVAPAYDTSTMAMTAALSDARQWSSYASWLPLVADQISAIDGGAFGARGIMAQNLQNSTAYAAAAKEYREFSQKTQQSVTDARNNSQDKNNVAFREGIGGVQTYVNPYDTRVPVELPDTYKYFWVNPQGTYQGTDDPSVNPNNGSTGEWKRLPKRQP